MCSEEFDDLTGFEHGEGVAHRLRAEPEVIGDVGARIGSVVSFAFAFASARSRAGRRRSSNARS